jgi:enterochelin esterase-like enzyme
MDVATLANLLREAAERHHHYEQVAPEHDWAEWYAPT